MADINRFIELISILRNKCPWDKKQTLETMKSNIIEEAYELVEAIELDETDALKEE
ncbi:MAG TPA: nucleoside triphosphate pyrophosphohydrolase, partial [candidate division WOR-3 bacterium]|nr:nucleoside triphosphate pyrophosphohydrolase [candidate division WOR-3 bacterium]